MIKNMAIAFVLLIPAFISNGAFCQQVNTISGTVAYVDPEVGVLDVQTDNGIMKFYITVETNIFRKTQPMASIEITKSDPVIVQYIVSSGRNDTVKIVDTAPSTLY